MNKEIKKVESTKIKRFKVLENSQEVINTSKKDEALDKVKLLQEELKPLIILLDTQENKSTRYTKTIHQKNYRIEAGNFEKDSSVKPVLIGTETEE